MATVIPSSLPKDLLARVRGRVKDARLTYPERVHFDVTDYDGGRWFLATWEADYTPADPEEMNGKTVVSAELVEPSGVLVMGFSDGTVFKVIPIRDDEDEAIENWELFTPDGMLLSYGPRGRWHYREATGSD